MKKLIFGSLLGFALVAFTGCTTGDDAEAGMKCQSGKCQSASKCSGDKAKETAAKCSASSKCGK